MRYQLFVRCFFLSIVAACAATDVEVYFSPNGQCTSAAVAEINKAYNFTSPEILAALVDAHKRGVAIQAIYDRSQANDAKTLADELEAQAGVVRWYGSQKIMHCKVLVIDHARVLTGSFNWTTNAQKFNAENMLVLTDPDIAKQYEDEFQVLLKTAHK